MEDGKIKYAGHNTKKAIKCLYEINDTLPLFAKGATRFSDRDMAKRSSEGTSAYKQEPNSLSSAATAYVKKQTSWHSAEYSKSSSTSSWKPNERNDRKDRTKTSTMATITTTEVKLP